MNDTIFYLGFLLGMIIMGLVMTAFEISKADVIKHGCAEYDIHTGEFKFIKKVKDVTILR